MVGVGALVVCACVWGCGYVQAFTFVPLAKGAAMRGRLVPRHQSQAGVSPANVRHAPWAVIFDCDGVILESEGLHREAYNAMFAEFGIPYRWSEEYYDELQNKIGGGKPKMKYYFGEHGWPEVNGLTPATPQQQEEALDVLQDRKTALYKSLVEGGSAVLRPGIKRLIDDVHSRGIKLALCSASTKSACMFVLENLLTPSDMSKFEVILAGDDVPLRKPHPMIYEQAARLLNVQPDRCVVVEDSLIGLQAALGAGMQCVITYTHSTKSQDFLGQGARAVYADLDQGQVTALTLAQFVDSVEV